MTVPGPTPLPYPDARHQAAAQFLVEEAHLLDTAQFEAWLGLLHPSIRYRMPVRVTTANGTSEADVQTMDHFDEDLYSLRKRVERLQTDHAWAEDPMSRVRHHISNVRCFATASGASDDAEHTERFIVESSVLLYRSRGDRTPPSLLSAGRIDTLVTSPDGLRLAERLIEIDESVLRTQNLAIFL